MALIVLPDPSLRERTTLRLGGTAIAEVRFDAAADCDGLAKQVERLGGTPKILGYGSNILADDGPLPLVLITPAVMDAPQVVREDAGGVYVRVGAGFRLPRLLGWLCAKGLTGMEGLAGIPGTVGGAVAMNAGSYGCETGERLVSADVFDPAGGLRTVERASMQCGYRHFSVLGQSGAVPVWQVITAAVFRLDRGDRDVIHAAMRTNYRKKKATQPVTAYTAGCVFKNPMQGLSAGKILDDAGFRGKGLGGMRFSIIHANFLENTGTGTSMEAKHLISEAQGVVHASLCMTLELEVKVFS